jgi:hypothetical protein
MHAESRALLEWLTNCEVHAAKITRQGKKEKFEQEAVQISLFFLLF